MVRMGAAPMLLFRNANLLTVALLASTAGVCPALAQNELPPQSPQAPLCDSLPGAATGGPRVLTYVDDPPEMLKSFVPGLRGIQFEAQGSGPVGAQPSAAQDKAPAILHSTGEVIADLMHRMPNLIAKEVVVQPIGITMGNGMPSMGMRGRLGLAAPSFPEVQNRTASFNYRIVHRNKSAGVDILDELRTDAHDHPLTGSTHDPSRPYSVGFATAWLFFYPGNFKESRYRYLGRQKIGSHQTLVVAFAQIPGLNRMQTVIDSTYGVCAAASQGVAWIDASTYQIVRMQTDLLAPQPAIQLNQLRSVLNYSAVKIPARDLTLWLPTEVEVTWQTAYTSGVETHRYSNYRLFEATMRILPADESPPK